MAVVSGGSLPASTLRRVVRRTGVEVTASKFEHRKHATHTNNRKQMAICEARGTREVMYQVEQASEQGQQHKTTEHSKCHYFHRPLLLDRAHAQ
jgi:hypothetical protein